MANSAGIILGIIEAKSIEHSASIIEHFVSIGFKNGSAYTANIPMNTPVNCFKVLVLLNSEKASQTTITTCRLMIADNYGTVTDLISVIMFIDMHFTTVLYHVIIVNDVISLYIHVDSLANLSSVGLC